MTLKKKNLSWAAMMLHNNPVLNIEPFFAIPYNSFYQYYDRRVLLLRGELWKKVSNNNFSILDFIKIIDNFWQTIKKGLLPLCKKFKF